MSRADAAGGDNNVVGGGECACRINDGLAVVGDGFDLFEVDPASKEKTGEVGGVGIDGLREVGLERWELKRKVMVADLAVEDFVAYDEAGGGVDLAGFGRHDGGGRVQVVAEFGETGEHQAGGGGELCHAEFRAQGRSSRTNLE